MKLSQKNLATTSFVLDGCQKCSLMFTKHKEWHQLWCFCNVIMMRGMNFLTRLWQAMKHGLSSSMWKPKSSLNNGCTNIHWINPGNSNNRWQNRKLMATVFWDRKGALLIEFMEPWTTITSEKYCETLKKLCRAIENKRRRILMSGVVLLHDNACPQALLQKFCWDLFDHPPYRPDLAPEWFPSFFADESLTGNTALMCKDEWGADGWCQGLAQLPAGNFLWCGDS